MRGSTSDWRDGSSRSLGDGRELLADRIGGHYEAALARGADAGHGDRRRAIPRGNGRDRRGLARPGLPSMLCRSAPGTPRSTSFVGVLALTTPDAGVDAGRRMIRLATTLAASGDLGEALRLAERSEAIQRAAFRQADPGSDDRARARDDYARASDARADMEAEQLHFLEARAIAEATLASSRIRTTSPGRASACGAHGRWRSGTTHTTPPRSRMSCPSPGGKAMRSWSSKRSGAWPPSATTRRRRRSCAWRSWRIWRRLEANSGTWRTRGGHRACRWRSTAG